MSAEEHLKFIPLRTGSFWVQEGLPPNKLVKRTKNFKKFLVKQRKRAS